MLEGFGLLSRSWFSLVQLGLGTNGVGLAQDLPDPHHSLCGPAVSSKGSDLRIMLKRLCS
jgi:hypothetical protein